MEWKITIFDSEMEFRNCIIINSKKISKIYVFEDVGDKVIFFYCFFIDYRIVSTKELAVNGFAYYEESYLQLAKDLHLKIDSNFSFANAIKLIS